MNILCVIDSLNSGGAQRQLVEIAIGLKENGNTVSFLTYHPSDFYLSILQECNISIICIEEERYLIRFFKMRKFIRSGNYDGVISFLEASNFICELCGFPFRKWKLVVGERSANPRIYKSFKLKFYRWFHLLADYVVSNSHSNMELVKKINPLLSDKKCKVVYNIVDFNKWQITGEYFPVNNGIFNIVIAASHQYLKNLLGLIEAVHLLENVSSFTLRINWHGDNLVPPYIDNSIIEAKDKITEYKLWDIFQFHEASHKIPIFVSQADAIGLFSFYEGLPNIICEGMACEKPIICSNVSDLPFLLSKNGNFLFDPNSIDSIVKALRDILSMNKEQLLKIGKKNGETARACFSKEEIVKFYQNLLE